jgi:hypothetical protein
MVDKDDLLNIIIITMLPTHSQNKKGKKRGILFGEKQESWNPKFVNRIRKELTTMVCPCKENGQNKDSEKGIRIKT